ncbi:hypothetical protein T11_1724, partial [Trichinella zimbabwensis]
MKYNITTMYVQKNLLDMEMNTTNTCAENQVMDLLAIFTKCEIKELDAENECRYNVKIYFEQPASRITAVRSADGLT